MSEKVKLGAICDFVNGKAFNANDWEESGVPIIRIQNVNDESKSFNYCIKSIEEKYKVKNGDLLFSWSGTPGTSFGAFMWTRGDAYLNQHIFNVKIDSEVVDKRFLYHSLNASIHLMIDQAHGGVGLQHITKKKLEGIEINLPPLEEQKRIAAILDKADSLRRKRQQAISLADDFLRAVFLDMFGDPVTNLKGWPVSELKALGQVSTGRTPPGDKPGMFDGETPFVTPGDLESDAPAKRSLTEAGVAEVSTVRSGATLVCCIGATIGKMGKATQRSAFNQQINAVEWNGLVDDDYGLAALRFFKAEIARQGASTTLPILKKSSFEKLLIPVPPIELQQVFTEQVAKAERLRFSTKTSLAEIESLQAALQNESFA